MPREDAVCVKSQLSAGQGKLITKQQRRWRRAVPKASSCLAPWREGCRQPSVFCAAAPGRVDKIRDDHVQEPRVMVSVAHLSAYAMDRTSWSTACSAADCALANSGDGHRPQIWRTRGFGQLPVGRRGGRGGSRWCCVVKKYVRTCGSCGIVSVVRDREPSQPRWCAGWAIRWCRTCRMCAAQ